MRPFQTSARTSDPYFMHCRFCGRSWSTKGLTRSSLPARRGKSNATGFIVAAADAHAGLCYTRTPAQRRKQNRKDEARWLRSPPLASRIWNDPTHAGLQDRTA